MRLILSPYYKLVFTNSVDHYLRLNIDEQLLIEKRLGNRCTDNNNNNLLSFADKRITFAPMKATNELKMTGMKVTCHALRNRNVQKTMFINQTIGRACTHSVIDTVKVRY